ncbi:hypothetical protein LOK49_LG05G00761 [Camellia lanceoleosa]|uniref:Uncharacterized protein n=1 Tax=Camellia lanceoleosa TaxID=1840588 RepID=A0ACC0HPN4_9ERIC|nr:hypothetical protein LOK49_LG05G00761 [Camellia lanceoleosa]
MAAQMGSFMAKTLIPMPNFKPYQLRNIIICAKGSENTIKKNKRPGIKTDPPQNNGIGKGNSLTNSVAEGGDNIGKTNADDVNVMKSEYANN